MVETTAMAYSCYQFTNVLAGQTFRVLDVLVAEDNPGTNFVTEARAPKQGKQPAFLLTRYMAGAYSPAEYFRDHYPTQNPEAFVGRSMYLCAYGDSKFDLYFLRRSPITGEAEWLKTEAQSELRWAVSSRTGYVLGHLRYVYAVPLDIVTSPDQLFVMLKLAND
jgi:hypothetical protein